jgi:hypothetical protein
MFEFPLDKNSYDDIESKIMIGEALLLCAFFDSEEKKKLFFFLILILIIFIQEKQY